VRGAAVESILADNAYQITTEPCEGDLAVFHDSFGKVTHTGLVRGHSSGTVLIESKWGQMGRFVHTARDHPYGADALTYYHTPRGTHLLLGPLEAPPREPVVLSPTPHANH